MDIWYKIFIVKCIHKQGGMLNENSIHNYSENSFTHVYTVTPSSVLSSNMLQCYGVIVQQHILKNLANLQLLLPPLGLFIIDVIREYLFFEIGRRLNKIADYLFDIITYMRYNSKILHIPKFYEIRKILTDKGLLLYRL